MCMWEYVDCTVHSGGGNDFVTSSTITNRDFMQITGLKIAVCGNMRGCGRLNLCLTCDYAVRFDQCGGGSGVGNLDQMLVGYSVGQANDEFTISWWYDCAGECNVLGMNITNDSGGTGSNTNPNSIFATHKWNKTCITTFSWFAHPCGAGNFANCTTMIIIGSD